MGILPERFNSTSGPEEIRAAWVEQPYDGSDPRSVIAHLLSENQRLQAEVERLRANLEGSE